MAEIMRVLRPDGFALLSSPDLEAIARLILDHGLDHVAYTSSAGPITPLDMMFGHSESIARGNTFMSHRTGFTSRSLGTHLADAGFATVLVKRERLDLWALALGRDAEPDDVQHQLALGGLRIFDECETQYLDPA